jgi:MbtH protein
METSYGNGNRNANNIYRVVMNHEEQYSIWPVGRELPRGWSTVGKDGSKDECLKYIEEVWTDMRPLSLRKAMEGNATGCQAGSNDIDQQGL